MKEEHKGISIELALESYNTLKQYCKQQRNCDNCLLALCESYPEYICLMELSEIPRKWQDLEL